MFPRTSEQKTLKNLLEQKYINVKVEVERRSTDGDQISVVLFNSRNGINNPVDEENVLPINFLKAFGAKETREEYKYPYWSNSVLTFNYSQMNNIIQGLEKLSLPKKENQHGKVMAMC